LFGRDNGMMMALYASGVGDLLSVGAKLGVTPQKV